MIIAKTNKAGSKRSRLYISIITFRNRNHNKNYAKMFYCTALQSILNTVSSYIHKSFFTWQERPTLKDINNQQGCYIGILKICFLVHYIFFNILLFLKTDENEAESMKENNEDILHSLRIFLSICLYVKKQRVCIAIFLNAYIHSLIREIRTGKHWEQVRARHWNKTCMVKSQPFSSHVFKLL